MFVNERMINCNWLSSETEEDRLMKIVLEHSQYKVLEELLRYDLNPEHLTMYPGDTPVHAALIIGLKQGVYYHLLVCGLIIGLHCTFKA
jgi:hypothetical protein